MHDERHLKKKCNGEGLNLVNYIFSASLRIKRHKTWWRSNGKEEQFHLEKGVECVIKKINGNRITYLQQKLPS